MKEQPFDFVIIGAGPAGEAAASLARKRGASVAVVDRDLFGGACPFWACMPSKALLHAAAVHHAGGDYDWPRASAFRDWMINREGIDYPDDSSHFENLNSIGASPIRGTARIVGPGRVDVAQDGSSRALDGRNLVVAVGSHSKVPSIEGLEEIEPWTNVQATTARELPRSLVILGGGPTGVELAQVYARYGVPTVIIDSNPRLLSRDHPRNSEAVANALRGDGVDVRLGTRSLKVRPAAGAENAHVVELSDGSTAEGHEILLAVGREFPLAGLGLEAVGVSPDERGAIHPDEQLRIAEGVFVAGDPAGPELHTHLAHYQGEMAVRIALGDDVRPDYTAIPRATYTDPEAASVGLTLEQAREQGIDAFEETVDLAGTAKGNVTEATGHVTLIIDRGSKTLAGAAIAGPGASEAIHEAVLAVKLRVPLATLADTIHAFPTVARAMGGLFASAAAKLE
ncbi:MAG: NAD(P)/FAD-dependent oxidoreductase [Chloroflexi bacterium]|nr:NAD(P)/FAD-dependent oxidoreductase [Chloroflexota bacterium]